uniref:Synaptobrevin, longin-like domain protein n=1 Tax=Tanacetum cinerariifolium TaxID=118510 RepID=A0A699KG53_TANCI|nr:hypothetical protein [Tanacetum cinerariifolium]
MTLTFANTHNMIAYLTKSNASEGFNQIIDFLNGSSIKYALTVNTNIYILCIKKFWTSVAMKKVNEVMRLQALVDKKKVVITKDTIRDALRLDDAEGVECLPIEEIFTVLDKMGYEKPSTKLNFYKAFFSSQWKFLIHTILQCMSAKRTSWNEFSSSMASVVICLSTSRKFNFSKYIFDSLVRNVDSSTNFYMYPRFLQLMIRKQVCDLSTHTTKYASPVLTHKHVDEGDTEVNVDDVSTVGVAVEGDVSAANDEVPTVVEEPSITSPTPPTPPSHNVPSTSQVQLTPPQSPQVQPQSPQHQPQPLQDAGISIDLLQNLLDTCTTLTRRVEHLEYDKVAQALEITKLKSRVKKLERRNKESKLKRMIADMDADVDVSLGNAKEFVVEKYVDVDESADVQGRKVESQAQIYQIDLEHANKVLSMQDDKGEPPELQEVVEVVTTAKLITEVVTAASATLTAATPQLTTTAAPTLTTAPSAARRRKGVILVEETKPLKKQAQIEQDGKYARELKAELNKNIDMHPSLNLEKSKKCSWSSKGQELEAVRVLWCTDHYIYNNIVDFASRDEISTHKVHSGSDA